MRYNEDAGSAVIVLLSNGMADAFLRLQERVQITVQLNVKVKQNDDGADTRVFYNSCIALLRLDPIYD